MGVYAPEALAETNGHPSDEPWEQEAQRLDGFIEAQRTELRDLLGQERALVARIQGALDACKERERRVMRALAALEGTAVLGRPAGKPAKPTTKPPEGWTPRPETLTKTYDALVALGEGRTKEVGDRAGLSNETARRALNHLRNEERVRVVRQSRKFGPIFAPMPSEDSNGA